MGYKMGAMLVAVVVLVTFLGLAGSAQAGTVQVTGKALPGTVAANSHQTAVALECTREVGPLLPCSP